MKTTAIFPGSFDPFTIGHDDIARRALLIADRLVIAVGVNDKKKYESDTEQRIEAIARIYADNPRVEVVAYEGLTIDLARHLHANFIVKGVRSVKDFEYEREQADINSLLANVETIFLPAKPHLASISSSLVRELNHLGRDTTPFLPKPTNNDNL